MRRIAKHRHVPKAIYSTTKELRAIKESQKKKYGIRIVLKHNDKKQQLYGINLSIFFSGRQTEDFTANREQFRLWRKGKNKLSQRENNSRSISVFIHLILLSYFYFHFQICWNKKQEFNVHFLFYFLPNYCGLQITNETHIYGMADTQNKCWK